MAVRNPSKKFTQPTAYTCNGMNKDRWGCPALVIRASTLDESVWSRVTEVLLQPKTILAEVERRRSSSGAEHDLKAIDQRLASIDRRRQNLVRAISLVDDDPDSAALMAQELRDLSAQRKKLEAEQQAMALVQADANAKDRQLLDLAAWCSRAAANLETLTYAERRTILEALGVKVRVWRADHNPRWEMEMAPLPVDPNVPIAFKTAPGRCGCRPR
jgi:hypothetical protein